MAEDPRQIISSAYDHIASWYLEWTLSTPSPRETYTQNFLARLPPRPSILELGCGPGMPILQLLLSHNARVTANDISPAQIEMAKERCPGATFIAGDMSRLNFFEDANNEGEGFDGVVSFFTLFHLPRRELQAMLEKIFAWLRPGGMFVFNLATVDEEEIHGEMMGHGMFWSSFGVEENKGLIASVGFEILECEVLKAGDGKLEEDDPDYDTEFMWIIAGKKKEEEEEEEEEEAVNESR